MLYIVSEVPWGRALLCVGEIPLRFTQDGSFGLKKCNADQALA